jgi:DNA segregation ATPase FtsK/SpoIIIE-like protein
LGAILEGDGIGAKVVSKERGARYYSVGVRLKNPRYLRRALNLGEELATATNTQVCIVSRQGAVIYYQFGLPPAYHKSYTRAVLKSTPGHAVIGLAEKERPVELVWKSAAPHALVAGTTGSGKTWTTRSMLVALAGAYTPDELQLLIFDLKGEFGDFTNVAHLHGWPIARNDQDFNRAMSYVSDQLKQREAMGVEVSYRRLVVVIDEAEAIMQDGKRLQIARALVQRGRGVRINGLFATQEPHKGKFKSLLGQINNRWVGLVANADASWRVTGHPALAANKLSGDGDFLHIEAGGMHDRLQVATATQADYDRLPHAEIAPPADVGDSVDPVDPDRLPSVAGLPDWEILDGDDVGPGRPRNEIEPETLGYYLYRPDAITERQAREELELSRHAHRQYKAFARRALIKVRELRERDRINGGQ